MPYERYVIKGAEIGFASSRADDRTPEQVNADLLRMWQDISSRCGKLVYESAHNTTKADYASSKPYQVEDKHFIFDIPESA
jgi:hypothetical protein